MWWDSLSALQQVMFIIATVATSLMILLIIMMLIGMDGGEAFDGDIDVDVDLDDVDGGSFGDSNDVFNQESFFSLGGLKIITIRGMLAFFSIGGWVVFMMADSAPVWLAMLVGVLSGSVAAVLLALIMRAIFRLESSGNLDYSTAIGKIATVYIRIPKNTEGKGKIMLVHQGKMIEVDAITKDINDILSKKEVKIVGLEDETTFLVESINQ
jgi:ABC-type branched-subunit amino acid transport system permease subunit